jgi:hypothetical protein
MFSPNKLSIQAISEANKFIFRHKKLLLVKK